MASNPSGKKSSKKSSGSRAIEVKPSPSQLKKVQECLQRSGKIKIGFKEVTVTKLPKSIAPVMVFID